MEHPILFLDVILGFFHVHIPPHITYSWLIMAMLIGVGYMASRQRALVPAGGQNFFETLIGGLEEFMVEITGEEGRTLSASFQVVFLLLPTSIRRYPWPCVPLFLPTI